MDDGGATGTNPNTNIRVLSDQNNQRGKLHENIPRNPSQRPVPMLPNSPSLSPIGQEPVESSKKTLGDSGRYWSSHREIDLSGSSCPTDPNTSKRSAEKGGSTRSPPFYFEAQKLTEKLTNKVLEMAGPDGINVLCIHAADTGTCGKPA